MNTAKAVESTSTGKTAKEEVEALLRNLPDDCTLEDIQYHIHVLQKMKRSEQDSDEGRVYTQEEVEEYFSQWLTP